MKGNTYSLLKLCKHISSFKFVHTCGVLRTKLCVDGFTNGGNEILSKTAEKRFLKIAIVGTPNAGKSTLINQIMNRRIFPISKKVHTTRFRARAVYNEDNIQLIFLDTPGLVTVSESQKYKLKPDFITGGEQAIMEADVIGVVHDLSNHFTRNNLGDKVLRLLHLNSNKESFLVLNKTDTIKSRRHLLEITKILTNGKLKDLNKSVENLPLSEKCVHDIIKNQQYWENFREVFMTSALLGTGTSELKTYLLNSAQLGEWLFPEDSFTDQSPRQIIQETVRAKLLEHLPQEVPYNLNVCLEYLDLDQKDCIMAVVNVRCNTTRIENLVKGNGGNRIRTIAVEAEQTLSDAFLTDFRLRVVVCSKQL